MVSTRHWSFKKICPSDSNVHTSWTTVVLHVMRVRTGLTSLRALRGTQPRGRAHSRYRPPFLCSELVPYPQTGRQHGVLRGENTHLCGRERGRRILHHALIPIFQRGKLTLRKSGQNPLARSAGRGWRVCVDDSTHLLEQRGDSDKSDANYVSGWLPELFL